jgi:hypothetical protein
VATRRSSEPTVHPAATIATRIALGEVSVCTMRPSSPRSNAQRPISIGSRSDGVPEKPMRQGNKTSPPSSCSKHT